MITMYFIKINFLVCDVIITTFKDLSNANLIDFENFKMLNGD